MAKTKKVDSRPVSVRNLATVHYIYAECGVECEVPKGSVCKHCGCVMDKVRGKLK